MVNPCIPERGIAELEWALERGARAVLLRPGPVAGTRGTRSPFLPAFDEFWAKVESSGVLVAMHASDSGYQRYANEWEGEDRAMMPFAPRPFSVTVNTGRPISDAVTSAVCHGMLSRFPGVRLLSVENGGSWALHCLAAMEKTYGKMPNAFAEHPRDVFLRNIYINPFWEDSLEKLIDVMTPGHILFGSDYPHPEGLAEPFAWAAEVSELYPADDVRKIMGGNMSASSACPSPPDPPGGADPAGGGPGAPDHAAPVATWAARDRRATEAACAGSRTSSVRRAGRPGRGS